MAWNEICELLTTHKKVEHKEEVGFFVGCGCHGGIRDSEHAHGRQLITLDFDKGGVEPAIDYDHIRYTTFSHTPELPRYRYVLQIDRVVSAHEYKHIVKSLMAEFGGKFDEGACVDYTRAMYLPSSPNGDGIAEYIEGFAGIVVADEFTIPEFDPSTLIIQDPRNKAGIIGEFCKVFTISKSISLFLNDTYKKDGTRYTFTGSTGKRGARVYDNDLHFYSDHDSDPANDGHCKNAYDLVRIHMFAGDSDLMGKWANELPEIQELRIHEFEKIERVKEIRAELDIDLIDAPGILGEMINDILPNMDRTVPEYAIGAALHGLSMVANQSYKSYSRAGKLNLMTITIGESASGKDVPQRYVSGISNLCGQPDWPAFTSYQEITRNLLRGNGMAYYVVDECQGMFEAENSKQDYLSNLGSEIMKLSTAEKPHRLRGNDTASLTDEYEKKKAHLEALKDKDGDISAVDFEVIEAKIADIDRKLDMVKNGIQKPDLSIYGATTPVSFKGFITEKTLKSGNFSRFTWLIPDLEGNVPPLNRIKWECTGEFNPNIQERLKKIISMDGDKIQVKMSDEAEKRDIKISLELDEPEYRNHIFGAIWRRAYQKVSKIASILGAGDGGEVTVAHLNWAYKFVMTDINGLTRHHRESKLAETSDSREIYHLYRDRVLELIKVAGGEIKKGVLAQKVVRKKEYDNKDILDSVIKTLIKKGRVQLKGAFITIP